jgi:hypothetical protein
MMRSSAVTWRAPAFSTPKARTVALDSQPVMDLKRFGQRAYFRELLSAVNSALILASIPATATRIPSAMPVAIRQYSMAVAAVSSTMNLKAAFTDGW